MPYSHSHGKQIYGKEEKESIERVNHIYRNEESIWRGTKDLVVVEERKKKLLLKAKPRRKENGGFFFLSWRNMERNRNLLRIRITKKKNNQKSARRGRWTRPQPDDDVMPVRKLHSWSKMFIDTFRVSVEEKCFFKSKLIPTFFLILFFSFFFQLWYFQNKIVMLLSFSYGYFIWDLNSSCLSIWLFDPSHNSPHQSLR